jgi:mono/diheme cytochrome c family protein
VVNISDQQPAQVRARVVAPRARRWLLAAALGAAIGFAVGCATTRGSDDGDARPTDPAKPVANAVESGDLVAGARIFADWGCASCHTLAAAGAHGSAGPNLDRHFAAHSHSLEETMAQIRNGGEGMPAYGALLSGGQIRDVATFVIRTASAP